MRIKYTYSGEAFTIKSEEVIKILKKAGWIDTGRGKGSHRVFVNPATKQITTIPRDKDLSKGTLAAIRKQTGIDEIR
jgi:predicted RNA binding protein YcfA (HicA-like mRNA interferase family)